MRSSAVYGSLTNNVAEPAFDLYIQNLGADVLAESGLSQLEAGLASFISSF
jgi:hypothetical protein